MLCWRAIKLAARITLTQRLPGQNPQIRDSLWLGLEYGLSGGDVSGVSCPGGVLFVILKSLVPAAVIRVHEELLTTSTHTRPDKGFYTAENKEPFIVFFIASIYTLCLKIDTFLFLQ